MASVRNFVKKPTSRVDKNAVAVVLPISHCKEKVVGYVHQNISMVVSMFLSLHHCALDIFATGKHTNHGGEYRLKITSNFHFMDLNRQLNWLKK